ncbi:MAG: hypothetical protein ACKOB5_12345, partial [Betaproteobacteria bacterium]
MGAEVTLIDTAAAVARRVACLAGGLLLSADAPKGGAVQLWTSAAPAQLEGFAQRWLRWPVSAQALGGLPPPVGATPPASTT